MRPSEALALHRDEIRALVARYRFTDLRVFGSTARGEDREDSDLDLTATPPEGGTNYFELSEIGRSLESMTGVKVDFFPSSDLKDEIGDAIRQEAQPV